MTWLSVLNFLLGWQDALAKRRNAQLDAMSEEQRILHEENQQERKGRIEVRKRTALFWEMRVLTFLITFPFVAHLWAVWLDTQFNLDWSIDKFPAPFDQWQGTILLSFFGVSTGLGIAKIASGTFTHLARRK